MFCVWNKIIQIQIRSDLDLFALADQEPKWIIFTAKSVTKNDIMVPYQI